METLSTENQLDVFRPLPDYPPSVWGYTFDSFSATDSEFESRTQEVDVLKEKVKDMLMQSTRNPSENIEFINLLCRLGVSYHFETEIENQLNDLFRKFQNLHEDNDYDLYTVALAFRVLRQHGFRMSCDVFKKFKNSNGEFKKNITTDVKGLLSLYEASFLSFHGEDILDETLDFTKKHLEISVEKSSPHLEKHIKNALNLPFHHGLGRVETLKYISFYEKEESRNETLLKFAKLDYNRLQLLYRKELALLSRWWKDLNLLENIPYVRDRIVESYVWGVGTQFEPQYAFARLIGTKYIKIVSLLDDTFDAYGTIDELQCFTAAFQRCSIDAFDQLPNYMKFLYKTILNLLDETENDENEGIRYRASFAKERLKEIVRCYLKESQWLLSNENVPSFDEYVENGLVTGTFAILPTGFMIGIEELGINDYEWMENNPKLFNAVQFHGRLKNDIMPHGYEVEKNEGGPTLGLQSYMKHYGVSEKEAALEGIKKMCDNKWKDINEEYCMKPRDVSRILLKHYVEHARATYFFYNGIDCYTHASYLKDVAASLFIDPIPL